MHKTYLLSRKILFSWKTFGRLMFWGTRVCVCIMPQRKKEISYDLREAITAAHLLEKVIRPSLKQFNSSFHRPKDCIKNAAPSKQLPILKEWASQTIKSKIKPFAQRYEKRLKSYMMRAPSLCKHDNVYIHDQKKTEQAWLSWVARKKPLPFKKNMP